MPTPRDGSLDDRYFRGPLAVGRAPSSLTRGSRAHWQRYLKGFHRERAGITGRTLGTAYDAGTDPYRWAIEPLIDRDRVLDIACGDAPAFAPGHASAWVGVDMSRAELDLARDRGVRCLVQADAGHLPIATGSVPAVLCSMGLMVLQPLDTVLSEIHRVLAPGGVAVALLPCRWPLRPSDLWRYGRLMAALRRTHLAYPNDWDLSRFRWRAERAALAVVDDRRRRFQLPLLDAMSARRFVESLYLPGVAPAHVVRASALAREWVPGDIGLPLRRLTVKAI